MAHLRLIKYFSLVLLLSGSAVVYGAQQKEGKEKAAAAFDGTTKKAKQAAEKLRKAISQPFLQVLNTSVASEIDAADKITIANDVSDTSQAALTYQAVDAVTQEEPTTPKGKKAFVATLDRVQGFKVATESIAAQTAANKVKEAAAAAEAQKNTADARIAALERQATDLTTELNTANTNAAKALKAKADADRALTEGLARCQSRVDEALAAQKKVEAAAAEASTKNTTALLFANTAATNAEESRIKAFTALDAANAKRRKKHQLAIAMHAIIKKVQKGVELENADKKALEALAQEPISPTTPVASAASASSSFSSRSSSSSSSSASAAASSSSPTSSSAAREEVSVGTSRTSAAPAAAASTAANGNVGAKGKAAATTSGGSSWLGVLFGGSYRYGAATTSNSAAAAAAASTSTATKEKDTANNNQD